MRFDYLILVVHVFDVLHFDLNDYYILVYFYFNCVDSFVHNCDSFIVVVVFVERFAEIEVLYCVVNEFDLD